MTFEPGRAGGILVETRGEPLVLIPLTTGGKHMRMRKTNTSGAVGVAWTHRRSCWRSRLKIDGVDRHLGHFQTRAEAIDAYNQAAKAARGEFARVSA